MTIQPHHAAVGIVMIGSLALAGVITLNHMPADTRHVTRLDLPRGHCHRPADGQVLHIVVAAQGGSGQYQVQCNTVAPRSRMPAAKAGA